MLSLVWISLNFGWLFATRIREAKMIRTRIRQNNPDTGECVIVYGFGSLTPPPSVDTNLRPYSWELWSREGGADAGFTYTRRLNKNWWKVLLLLFTDSRTRSRSWARFGTGSGTGSGTVSGTGDVVKDYFYSFKNSEITNISNLFHLRILFI